MGEKIISGSSTASKGLRGVHPRERASARARPHAPARARGLAVVRSRKAGSNAPAGGGRTRSAKSQAQIHEERMKNLRKAQRVRRKNIKEGRKMGANKGKR